MITLTVSVCVDQHLVWMMYSVSFTVDIEQSSFLLEKRVHMVTENIRVWREKEKN